LERASVQKGGNVQNHYQSDFTWVQVPFHGKHAHGSRPVQQILENRSQERVIAQLYHRGFPRPVLLSHRNKTLPLYKNPPTIAPPNTTPTMSEGTTWNPVTQVEKKAMHTDATNANAASATITIQHSMIPTARAVDSGEVVEGM
jgi:hypothetical protein